MRDDCLIVVHLIESLVENYSLKVKNVYSAPDSFAGMKSFRTCPGIPCDLKENYSHFFRPSALMHFTRMHICIYRL